MYTISKLPVIILSSKRTGSTALTLDITQQLMEKYGNIPHFLEPSNTILELLSVINNTNIYVLKLHAADLHKYPNRIKTTINTHECCLIRIRRRSIIDQITSHYIASQRNVWTYSPQNPYNFSTEEIDIDRIIRSIRVITYYNKILNRFSSIDVDLYYEDLEFTNTVFVKTPNPDNYLQIRKIIGELIPHENI